MESFPLKDVNALDMPQMRYVARNIFGKHAYLQAVLEDAWLIQR